MTTILRPAIEAITLADGLKTRRTYRNGCNFKLTVVDGVKGIGAGCCLYPGFLQGAELAMWKWIKENRDDESGVALLPDEPDVHYALVHIMSQEPCADCGGDIYFYTLKEATDGK